MVALFSPVPLEKYEFFLLFGLPRLKSGIEATVEMKRTKVRAKARKEATVALYTIIQTEVVSKEILAFIECFLCLDH